MLLMQEGLTSAARKDGRALQDIQRLVDDAGLTVRTVSKHELNMLSGNRSGCLCQQGYCPAQSVLQ